MTKAIEIIKQPRITMLGMISDLSLEQLNKIPAGFNNNILWNLGHMVAAQQGICYKRSGLETHIDDNFFNSYKPGTRPDKFIGEDEAEKIKGLLTSTLDLLETDLNKNLFNNITPWITRYGVEIANISDTLNFLPFHEGFHIGTISVLKHQVA